MFALFDRCEPPQPADVQALAAPSASMPTTASASAREAHAYFSERRPRRSSIEFRTLRRDGSVRWIVMRADLDRVQSVAGASSASRWTSPSTTARSTRCARRASAPR